MRGKEKNECSMVSNEYVLVFGAYELVHNIRLVRKRLQQLAKL